MKNYTLTEGTLDYMIYFGDDPEYNNIYHV